MYAGWLLSKYVRVWVWARTHARNSFAFYMHMYIHTGYITSIEVGDNASQYNAMNMQDDVRRCGLIPAFTGADIEA